MSLRIEGKTRNSKPPRKNMGRNFLDLVFATFFGSDSKGNGNKKQKWTNKSTSNLNVLNSKGNHQQNKKSIYWMGENICKSLKKGTVFEYTFF